MSPKNFYEFATFLKSRGIDDILIRKCLVVLTEKEHSELAKEIGISRSNFTAHINGNRTNAIAQLQISNYFKVPLKVLFHNEIFCP